MIDPDRALDFFEFVGERHRVWERRQAGQPGPWTDHPILSAHKFTCVFRIADYDSQYLLRTLTPDLSERDTLLRCFMFRYTGRVDSWDVLDTVTGYPTVGNLAEIRPVLIDYRDNGGRVFTSAYVTPPLGSDNTVAVLDLIEQLFTPGSPHDIVPDFLKAKDPMAQYDVLCSARGVGPFMASQILTDWGYSEQCGRDIEWDFDVCGPGAQRGAKALDPTAPVKETLRTMAALVHKMPDCPSLPLPGGGVRLPSLRDCQNLFCESSKLFRFMDRPAPTKTYKPAHPGAQPPLTLPTHWSK